MPSLTEGVELEELLHAVNNMVEVRAVATTTEVNSEARGLLFLAQYQEDAVMDARPNQNAEQLFSVFHQSILGL